MHPALDGVQTVSNGSSPPNYEDRSYRTALNAAIDPVRIGTMCFQQISAGMRTDLNRDISARLAQVELLHCEHDDVAALVLAAARV